MTAAPGLVLLYHRVTDTGDDRLGLAVGPELFAHHLDVVRDTAAVVALDRVRDPHPTRRIAITFDDGYADNVLVAAPILETAGVPATFFVVASDPATEHWWDRVEHLVDEAAGSVDRLDVTIAGRRLRADLRTPADRARTLRALNHRLRVLPPDAIETALADLGDRLGGTPAPCARHRRATPEELRALVARPGMTVGSHGCTHPMLSALPPADQARELVESRRRLATEVGRPVDLLAYPYGMAGSWSRTTERLARRAGYALACTNVGGLVRRGTRRTAVPRQQVWDWSPAELRSRIEGWFAGWP